MHLSSKRSRCWATALGKVGRRFALNFPLPGREAGARAQVGGAGQAWAWPGPGVWKPEDTWDGGRETCGPKFGRTGRTGPNVQHAGFRVFLRIRLALWGDLGEEGRQEEWGRGPGKVCVE